jgi:hypothetical protein
MTDFTDTGEILEGPPPLEADEANYEQPEGMCALPASGPGLLMGAA